ncbi:MAG: AtpZ/AtpI family protein [Anaerolineales bacterium]
MNGLDKKGQDEFRTAVTMTVVWVAGLTLAVIFLALFAGILLDKFLNTKPVFTVLLMVASIPLTIYLTFKVVRRATGRLQPAASKKNPEEVSHRDEDN